MRKAHVSLLSPVFLSFPLSAFPYSAPQPHRSLLTMRSPPETRASPQRRLATQPRGSEQSLRARAAQEGGRSLCWFCSPEVGGGSIILVNSRTDEIARLDDEIVCGGGLAEALSTPWEPCWHEGRGGNGGLDTLL